MPSLRSSKIVIPAIGELLSSLNLLEHSLGQLRLTSAQDNCFHIICEDKADCEITVCKRAKKPCRNADPAASLFTTLTQQNDGSRIMNIKVIEAKVN